MSDAKSARYQTHLQRASLDELDYLNGDSAQSPIVSEIATPAEIPSKTIIALALLFTILGFTIQIECIAYYQDVLGWAKPLLSLYLTHSSLALPWIIHLAYLRLCLPRRVSTSVWLSRYKDDLLRSVASVNVFKDRIRAGSSMTPISFLLLTMSIVTVVLNISGVSWFVALAYTTPGDLTAIYNCSAFFAAVFSIPLLKQKISWITVTAVALSIIGTLIIAYGDASPEKAPTEDHPSSIGAYRLLGNTIAALGAVAFGLYSVIFKCWTSIELPRHASSSFDLAVAASGLTGAYTCMFGWIAIVVLHVLGIETFVMPGLEVTLYLILSIIGGAASMTLLLLLVTWTTPVFGSVTSILSVFFVAIADWLLFGLMPSFATYIGGSLIFVAFGLLARDEATGSS